MNKTYRLIWNRRLNAWAVASELARACGKRSSGRLRAGLAVALLVSAAGPAAAADLASAALPSGGNVVAGQAEITTNGTRMDITQDSQRAIINWQGFDIGSDAQVNFAQPGQSSVTLNRVSGATASRIEGQLTANGQVFLVNPNGVLFGGGARVNASALVASLNLPPSDPRDPAQLDEAIESIFRKALGRNPEATEQPWARSVVENGGLEELAHQLLASIDFRYAP